MRKAEFLAQARRFERWIFERATLRGLGVVVLTTDGKHFAFRSNLDIDKTGELLAEAIGKLAARVRAGETEPGESLH